MEADNTTDVNKCPSGKYKQHSKIMYFIPIFKHKKTGAWGMAWQFRALIAFSVELGLVPAAIWHLLSDLQVHQGSMWYKHIYASKILHVSMYI